MNELIDSISYHHAILAFFVFVKALKEHIQFHLPHDQGWWSLHTKGGHIFKDGWHLLSNAEYVLILWYGHVFQWTDLSMEIIITMATVFIFHHLGLHILGPVILRKS